MPTLNVQRADVLVHALLEPLTISREGTVAGSVPPLLAPAAVSDQVGAEQSREARQPPSQV